MVQSTIDGELAFRKRGTEWFSNCGHYLIEQIGSPCTYYYVATRLYNGVTGERIGRTNGMATLAEAEAACRSHRASHNDN